MKKILLFIALASTLAYGQTNTFPSSGNVGIGTTTPGYKLNVVGPMNDWKAMFQGPDGYILIGPANSGWAHIYSDRGAFLFNQSVYSMGPFSSFSGSDLQLQTYGTTRMTIANATGNVGIGTTNPQYYRLELVDPNVNESGIRSATTYGGNSSYTLVAYSPSYSNVPAYANKTVLQTFDNPIAFSAYGTGSNNQIQFYTGGRTDSYKRMVLDQYGNVGIGTSSPYSHSRLHIKSPDATPWGFMVEATANDKVMAMGHDGTTGYISTSYLASGGWSGVELRTQNTTRVNIAADGNVGIGTTSAPQAKLQVSNGDLLLQNTTSGYPSLWLKNVAGNNTLKLDYNSIIGAGSNLIVRSGSSSSIILNDVGGNVGIGTANPNQKLTVNGTIYGKEVKVDLSVPGPDYVFEKDYNLPSLEEIKKYIDANKHLPEVPSAKEMEANGVNVGEMNMLLLKKIEEMTLYIFELKNADERSKIQMEKMQAEINSLKNQK